jgi:imidazolonepropionase-like amidohydrolase
MGSRKRTKGKKIAALRVLSAFLLIAMYTDSARTQQSQNAPGATAKMVYLRCGALFDSKSDTTRKNVVIAIEGDKIKEVGAKEAAADVIDLSRETCLPGLVDTHTHVLLQGDITAADYDEQLLKQSPEYRTILATVNARRALEYGFTSIRDVETEGAGTRMRT